MEIINVPNDLFPPLECKPFPVPYCFANMFSSLEEYCRWQMESEYERRFVIPKMWTKEMGVIEDWVGDVMVEKILLYGTSWKRGMQ